MTASRRDYGLKALLLVGIFVLAALNAVLTKQNKELKDTIGGLRRALGPDKGMTVPALLGKDLAGRSKLVTYGTDSRPTLLLVFSPYCGICDDNWSNWQNLIADVDRRDVRLILVNALPFMPPSLAPKYQYLTSDFVAAVEPETSEAYRFRFTPQTILIDSVGKVQDVWTGLLTKERMAEIFKAIRSTESS